MCQVRGTWKSHDLCFRSPLIGLLDKKSIVVKGIRYGCMGILFFIVGLANYLKKTSSLLLSAMQLESACAEGFASLRTAFLANVVC